MSMISKPRQSNLHNRLIEIVPYNMYIFEGKQNYRVMFDLGTSNE